MAWGGDRSGFTLIGLLMVLTVIGVVGATAGPSLRQARMATNETAALDHLRDWALAQSLYHLRHGCYADDHRQLYEEGLLDGYTPPGSLLESLLDYLRQGYRYEIQNPPRSLYRWWGRAWPVVPGMDGVRHFYVDETGIIRWSSSGPADAGSPAL